MYTKTGGREAVRQPADPEERPLRVAGRGPSGASRKQERTVSLRASCKERLGTANLYKAVHTGVCERNAHLDGAGVVNVSK